MLLYFFKVTLLVQNIPYLLNAHYRLIFNVSLLNKLFLSFLDSMPHNKVSIIQNRIITSL